MSLSYPTTSVAHHIKQLHHEQHGELLTCISALKILGSLVMLHHDYLTAGVFLRFCFLLDDHEVTILLIVQVQPFDVEVDIHVDVNDGRGSGQHHAGFVHGLLFSGVSFNRLVAR